MIDPTTVDISSLGIEPTNQDTESSKGGISSFLICLGILLLALGIHKMVNQAGMTYYVTKQPEDV